MAGRTLFDTTQKCVISRKTSSLNTMAVQSAVSKHINVKLSGRKCVVEKGAQATGIIAALGGLWSKASYTVECEGDSQGIYCSWDQCISHHNIHPSNRDPKVPSKVKGHFAFDLEIKVPESGERDWRHPSFWEVPTIWRTMKSDAVDT